MKPSLIPLLLAALLTSCHEKAAPTPPPLSIRLQISAGGTFTGSGIPSSSTASLSRWLSKEIATGRVDPDVRLDFAPETPVWQMADTIVEALSAGTSSSSMSAYAIALGFGIEGWNGDDFFLHFIQDVETCCVEEWLSGADEWGTWVATEKYPGPRVEFSLTITGDTLSSDGKEINLADLTELFRSRSTLGPMLVSIYTDRDTTAGDLIPLMTIAGRYGALVNLGAEGQPKKESLRDRLRLQVERVIPAWQHLASAEVSTPSMRAQVVTTINIAVTTSWPTPPLLLPASFQLTATGSAGGTFFNPGSNQTTPFPFADAPP